jgi:dimethylhistidine N-methyltransferase
MMTRKEQGVRLPVPRPQRNERVISDRYSSEQSSRTARQGLRALHGAAGGAGVDRSEELKAGLLAPAPYIASKYFYDALGSRLFDAITRLPEYYPTRVEAGIFAHYRQQISQATGLGATLIDLGAGNCEKASSLFASLKPRQYVAIDISTQYLNQALGCLQNRYPDIEMIALGIDLSGEFRLPASVRDERRLFFYPGSSIGNFDPDAAEGFLSRLRRQCGSDGGLLIGVDLVKDKAILDAAYDDALGVTAAFNLNALNHVNAVLDSDFDVEDWQHRGFFNPGRSRAEMHLQARRPVTVEWPGGSRSFETGERIHTENSYKYRLGDFHALLERAGFARVTAWKDEDDWYAVCYARAA